MIEGSMEGRALEFRPLVTIVWFAYDKPGTLALVIPQHCSVSVTIASGINDNFYLVYV